MEPSSFISIAKLLLQPIIKALRWLFHQVKLKLFLGSERKRPVDKEKAMQIGMSILGGTIMSAAPFKNFGSDCQYLALVRKDNDEASASRIHLMERVGETYTQIWVSDPLWNLDLMTFEVTDIDADGWKEIVFEQNSFGTGAGSKSLFIYSMLKKKLYEITEYYNWQDASNPGSYPVINAKNDETIRNAAIKFAYGRGFLQANEIPDLDNPVFAVLRWHKENGDRHIGPVKIHWYEGMPICANSIAAELEANDIAWISYFKGPLYAYCKSKCQHFIAYSPQWIYEWVVSMDFDGNNLWFICHGMPGIFMFDVNDMYLRRYCSFGSDRLPEISSLSIKDGTLTVSLEDGTVALLSDLSRLGECRSNCKLSEPHLPGDCKSVRYSEIHTELNDGPPQPNKGL
jgi:hypothetical protein